MTLTLHAPQCIMLALILISIGISAALHGKEQPRYSIWTSLIGSGITFALLAWGGFFS